ncbi:hypothetical protein [Roseibium sp. RKSG952]|uniref:hypothetical protein n=1 Tax=Roseibium sp. RKSG952 TaxID=2529384 RepID=UPI0012BC0C02|nr:hypothetical protein [Roseibium sp. RKSG952]
MKNQIPAVLPVLIATLFVLQGRVRICVEVAPVSRQNESKFIDFRNHGVCGARQARLRPHDTPRANHRTPGLTELLQQLLPVKIERHPGSAGGGHEAYRRPSDLFFFCSYLEIHFPGQLSRGCFKGSQQARENWLTLKRRKTIRRRRISAAVSKTIAYQAKIKSFALRSL